MRYIPAFALLATVLFCGLCIQPVLAISADEWVNSGNELNQQGRYQEALQAFEKAISLDSKNKYAWTGKIGALTGLGRYDDALSAADFAETLDQSDLYFREMVFQAKGNVLKSLNRNQEALYYFDKALAINANTGFTWILKSDTLNQMGRSTEALQSAQKAVEIDPMRADAWTSKGYALQSLNRPQESLDAYNQALAIDSGNPWAWSGKSNVLFQMGRYAEALSSAEKALAIDPTRADFWNSKGDALLSLGRYQESLDAYTMAINYGNPWSWNGKINVFITTGRYAEALSAAEQALAIDPTNANLWNGKGSALQNLNRLQESLDAYNQALAIDSGNPWAWSGKSNVLNQMGRSTEALSAAEKALALDSGRANIWNSKGYALLSLGRYQESLDAFNAGLACDATNQNSQNGRQEALSKIGTGSGITGTPISTPNPTTVRTIIPTTVPTTIQSNPLSLPPSNSGDSNLTSATTADTMFRANPEHTGVYDKSGIVTTNTELWRFATGGYVSSSPAVWGGVVYIGTDVKNLFAIDAVTGAEKWRFAMGNSGFSSPAVSNGVVYIGSEDKNLYAIDAVTGIEKWRFETGGSVYTSPVVSNGVVYIGSEDKNLYAIDAVTGAENWRFATGGRVASSPAVSNGVVYFGTMDNNVYAIDAVTGAENWRFATEGYVASSPAVSNGVVYIVSNRNVEDGNNHILHAIDAVTGTEKWQFVMRDNGVPLSSPAVSNGVVYIARQDTNLYAIDAVTGAEKWRFKTGGAVESSPALSNGVVYIASQDTNLYAIDAVTGAEKWRFETGGSGYYSPSSPSVSNGVVYVWSNNKLWAIGDEPVTLITTPKAVSPSSSPSNGGDSNLSPTVSTPGIESILRSLPSLKSVYSKLSLLIIVILVMLFLVGGGYMIYRMKKKPSGCKPPERSEKNAIAPHPPSAVSTVQPELALMLDRTQLIANEWDRMTIQLTNHGKVPANNIRLTFSDEFDTKWIKPATIDTGETVSLDIAIRPKLKGKIPLEVTALYRDDHDKEYRETHEFWIEVVEKGKARSPPSETPKSPVSQFTPRPLTPKQLPPDLSDRYTESEFIGKGGFARVFKAKRKDGKYVAVKIPISMDAMTGKSFIAEMQNWTKLSHPNIVRLYDFNIMPLPYFEEELCDSALADQNKPIECEKVAWILFNICEGLKFAHTWKIIHRDLKPQNILLKNGVPKISDWGLSRIISESTTTTITSFTPHYAAPEQINGRVKDERTDIWQLGVILYELVTGILPFNGDSMVEIGMNIATKDPKRPSEIIPDAKVIDAVVMKCLQKDPAKRYQCVLELQKDLALYLRENYTELLKTSVTAKDYNRSAYYCGDLLMINLVTGDLLTSYKYVLDLVHYSKGDMKVEAQELCEQIKMRMEMGVTEIPDELIQKAEILVHQVGVGFRNRE